MIIDFPAQHNSFERIQSAMAQYAASKKSSVTILLSQSGRLDKNNFFDGGYKAICGSFSPFALFKTMRDLYKSSLGKEIFHDITQSLKEKSVFSHHIVNKALAFIEDGHLFFRRDAQFSPTIIRRPEKNIYFATSFTMAMTYFFVCCHRRLQFDQGSVSIIIENTEKFDRASFRLLQNLVLYLKDFELGLVLIFKEVDNSKEEDAREFLYRSRYIKARQRSILKMLHVFSASGTLTDPIKIDAAVGRMSFADEFAENLQNLEEEEISLDEAQDALYKSDYERLYLLIQRFESTDYDLKTETAYNKLTILCDAYNYLFDDALEIADK